MPASKTPDSDLLASILAIADAAGACAMDFWVPGQPTVNHWEKNPGDPVSEADLTVDAFLREQLSALLPEAAWLSEESEETPGRSLSRHVWIVDPIDGTRDFIHGRPGWCVSVALVEDGEAVVGVLIAPARQERWWAARGAGAWRNDKRLAVGSHGTLSGARIPIDNLPATDMGYRLVAKPNSIALRMAMIAADEADIVAGLRRGGEWDIAAASLIAQEAGACVTDALGAPVTFNKAEPYIIGMLCGLPTIHAAGLERVRPRALKLLGQH